MWVPVKTGEQSETGEQSAYAFLATAREGAPHPLKMATTENPSFPYSSHPLRDYH